MQVLLYYCLCATDKKTVWLYEKIETSITCPCNAAVQANYTTSTRLRFTVIVLQSSSCVNISYTVKKKSVDRNATKISFILYCTLLGMDKSNPLLNS